MKILFLSLLLTTAFCVSAAAQTNARPAPVTLEGQLVCSECWFEADRRTTAYGTEADMACAAECAERGVPAALAVTNAAGEATLYLLETGSFRRPGNDWLPFISQRVSITGTVRTARDKRYLRVDALRVLETAAQAPTGSETPTPAPQDAAASPAAELVLHDLSGVEQRLSSYRGRIVVLNFWATWCEPCRREMPDLAAIQNEYAAFGVQVIGASADAAAERARVLQFARETRINFPIWLGATTADMTRLDLGQVLPATAIIGRDGRIVARIRGIVNQADLRRRLDALMAETPAATPARDTREQEAGRPETNAQAANQQEASEQAASEQVSPAPSDARPQLASTVPS